MGATTLAIGSKVDVYLPYGRIYVAFNGELLALDDNAATVRHTYGGAERTETFTLTRTERIAPLIPESGTRVVVEHIIEPAGSNIAGSQRTVSLV